MNKLVSRNPVLRFKLGKKIVKAQGGLKAALDSIKNSINKLLDPDTWWNTKNKGFVYNNVPNPLEYIRNKISSIGNELVVENYTPENGGTINNKIRQSKLNKLNNTSSLLSTYKTPELKGSKEAYLNRLQQQGFTAKETPINNRTKKAVSAPKNNPPMESGFIKGYLNTDDIQNIINQYGGIKGFQQFLIDNKFLSGDRSKKEGADGWWGENTQKAYEAYLLKNALTLPTSEQLVLQVTQSTPVIEEVPQAGTNTILNLLTEMQKVMPATGTYTMKPILPKLNRSDTRWVISDALGKSAYDFTGALRKALRLYLNGEQYNANDLAAFGNLDIFNKYKSTQSYKQGGNMLPSRNIVKRFKLQKGNKLPNAPKAEDRFKNGVRDSAAYLGVPGKDNSYFGESIKRVTTPDNAAILRQILFRHYPYDNDTIYTEVPEHTKRLSILPQVNIIPRKGFSFAQTPEYEILKRRFNTAWNLAK